jgi:hypothetical protein
MQLSGGGRDMYSPLTDVVGLAAARPQLARATALSKMNALRSALGTMLCNGNSCVHPSLATSAFHGSRRSFTLFCDAVSGLQLIPAATRQVG